MVTYEHIDSASSSTHLQLMGRDEKPGGPSKYDLDTPGLMVLKDPGAGVVSPGAACSEIPAPDTSIADTPTGHRRVTGVNKD
jgi:hypothetical protein